MLQFFCPKETQSGEGRVALTPDTAKRLVGMGLTCAIEAGAGEKSGFGDSEYSAAGATVVADRAAGLKAADIVASVQVLMGADLAALKAGVVAISFLDPFRNRSTLDALAATGATVVSMEFIPRTTIAQKMDALSSQASLAGYAAVVLAAMRLDKIFPMMMTPAGTLQPSRVFIVGVGVAGLQAIATAKRMGARVTAFDTRPVVEEQVKSLGGKFLKIDLGETGQTAQGYANELTPEQVELQRKGMARACAESDVVITTAQVFGRPAPRLLTADMLSGMRTGSVVVDMAVSTGGNVEGSQPEQEVSVGGVRVIGSSNLPNTVPQHASTAYSNNIFNFIAHFWKEGALALDPSDDIARGAILAQDGTITNERLKS